MQNDNRELTRQRELINRAFGSDFFKYFNDDKVIEIMLNSDGKLWIDKLGEGMSCIGSIPASKSIVAINAIASILKKTVNYDNPILEGEFPIDNSRFAGQIPPVVPAPTFAIRKKAKLVFTLEKYVERGIMTENQMNAIKESIRNNEYLVRVSGTSSRKTTLTNACIDYMSKIADTERIVIIEDTGEIQCNAVNSVLFHTSLNVTITDLLKTTLRMRPDRIIIGEVRDHTALDLLDAWSTGHSGGISTIHANNSKQALERIEGLVTRHPYAPKDIKTVIASAVNLIVNIRKTGTTRKVEEIIKIHSFNHQNGEYEFDYI